MSHLVSSRCFSELLGYLLLGSTFLFIPRLQFSGQTGSKMPQKFETNPITTRKMDHRKFKNLKFCQDSISVSFLLQWFICHSFRLKVLKAIHRTSFPDLQIEFLAKQRFEKTVPIFFILNRIVSEKNLIEQYFFHLKAFS